MVIPGGIGVSAKLQLVAIKMLQIPNVPNKNYSPGCLEMQLKVEVLLFVQPGSDY
jgi:hypothetical protein